MITQQLHDYIRQQLDAGIDQSQITQTLLNQGWIESDVNQAFDSVINSNLAIIDEGSKMNPNGLDETLPQSLTEKNKKFILIVILLGIMALGVGAYFVTYKYPSSESSLQNAHLVNSGEKNLSKQKENVEFSKVVEISLNGAPPNKGYIMAGSNGGFWVVNNKLVYTLNYLDKSEHALICDGKEVYRASSFEEVMSHKPETCQSSSVSYFDTNRHILYYDGNEIHASTEVINVLDNLDKSTLAYYTFEPTVGQRFFFGDKVYDMPGTFFDAVLNEGKLFFRTTSGIFESGVKSTRNELPLSQNEVLQNKILSDFDSEIKSAKKKYRNIIKIDTIGGKLVLLAEKKVKEKNLYVLVYDGKELGVEYDSVVGYIESEGRPVYIAANYKRDNNDNIYVSNNAQFLIRDGVVLFGAKKGEEEIHSVEDLIDVNGIPAAIIRTPRTESLYVWYGGKKFFEGYNIHKILNFNGKLAVLVEKDRIQTIFIEQ